MDKKRAKGERLGTVPYGYDVGGDGKTLVINDREAAVVAKILQWYGEGFNIFAIANRLTKDGVPTKTQSGASWRHSTVARIVKRKFTGLQGNFEWDLL